MNDAAVRRQSRAVTEPAGEKRLSPPPPVKNCAGGGEPGVGVNDAAVRRQSRAVTEPAGEKRLPPPPPTKKPLLSTKAKEVFLMAIAFLDS